MQESDRLDAPRRAVIIAVIVSSVWLATSGVLLWLLGTSGALWLATAVAVCLPVVVIWFAALLARQSAEFRREADRVSDAADSVRRAAEAQRRPESVDRPAQPSAGAMRLPPAAPPALPRSVPRAQPAQERLPLADETAGPDITLQDMIRALDFPESAEDREGFRVLRLALKSARTRRLVQASQDILTLLSEEGIYMDDLKPDHAPPDTWRRFARGERAADTARVGGIGDRSSLALTSTRMRNDPVFRDAAHHFLRLFDKTLVETVKEADDAVLSALTDTRTARAFMLVGRVAGIFQPSQSPNDDQGR